MANKGPCRQSYGFSSSLWMWELDYKESWGLKNRCFWTVVLEKTLESPLDCKEIQPVHPKGNQPWIFIGRTEAEAEAPILWPPDVKNWLFGKDPDAGKEWGLEKKGMTEDEVVGWHHRLDGHEFEQAPGVGDGHGGLACCSPWGRKEVDMTERLNWTDLNWTWSLSFRHLWSRNHLTLQAVWGTGKAVEARASISVNSRLEGSCSCCSHGSLDPGPPTRAFKSKADRTD